MPRVATAFMLTFLLGVGSAGAQTPPPADLPPLSPSASSQIRAGVEVALAAPDGPMCTRRLREFTVATAQRDVGSLREYERANDLPGLESWLKAGADDYESFIAGHACPAVRAALGRAYRAEATRVHAYRTGQVAPEVMAGSNPAYGQEPRDAGARPAAPIGITVPDPLEQLEEAYRRNNCGDRARSRADTCNRLVEAISRIKGQRPQERADRNAPRPVGPPTPTTSPAPTWDPPPTNDAVGGGVPVQPPPRQSDVQSRVIQNPRLPDGRPCVTAISRPGTGAQALEGVTETVLTNQCNQKMVGIVIHSTGSEVPMFLRPGESQKTWCVSNGSRVAPACPVQGYRWRNDPD